MGTSFKITREEILKVYAAGPEAVIALIEGIIEQQEQRITALEQELQELKQDNVASTELLTYYEGHAKRGRESVRGDRHLAQLWRHGGTR